MASLLNQARQQFAQKKKDEPPLRKFPTVVHTSYTSLPVDYPEDFLAPLPNPSVIQVQKIDFQNSALPEYKNLYAVVLDNVLTPSECSLLLHYAECSKGAHANNPESESEPTDNGWSPALINAGRNKEVLVTEYRNSDRIIWDESEIARRLWKRVMQGEGMPEYFSRLSGSKYLPAIGSFRNGEIWTPTSDGLNERLRFLRYGPGQFFKEHCDGTYETPDGNQRSFYTYHLYLQDSAQALGIKEGGDGDGEELLRGGATTFHSMEMDRRIDVDPKMGRVLIFQHRRLLHSGDLVTRGTKFTMRSDVMFELEGEEGVSDDGVVFG